jgi:beta-xylosidase
LHKTFRNPILSGCYPDLSICRVGDDYYMVTSTFEYFPRLPIFYSRDLSTPVAGGFVGACIAMYASSNGQSSTNNANFDWFEYNGLDEA